MISIKEANEMIGMTDKQRRAFIENKESQQRDLEAKIQADIQKAQTNEAHRQNQHLIENIRIEMLTRLRGVPNGLEELLSSLMLSGQLTPQINVNAIEKFKQYSAEREKTQKENAAKAEAARLERYKFENRYPEQFRARNAQPQIFLAWLHEQDTRQMIQHLDDLKDNMDRWNGTYQGEVFDAIRFIEQELANRKKQESHIVKERKTILQQIREVV